MIFEHFLCNIYKKFIGKTQYFRSYFENFRSYYMVIYGHINPVSDHNKVLENIRSQNFLVHMCIQCGIYWDKKVYTFF